MFVNLKSIFLVIILLAIPIFNVEAQNITPDDLTDIAAPVGVDAADVARMFKLITGEETASEDDILRGRVAPGVLLSDPAQNPPEYPQRIRPNLQPDEVFTIGDAVLTARRAAGDIVFDELNAPPTIVLDGSDLLTDDEDYDVTGNVTDDEDVRFCTVEIWINGNLYQAGIPVNQLGIVSWEVELVEGANEIKARSKDIYGRFSPFTNSFTVTLDQTPPALTIDVPTPYTYINASQNPFQFSGTAFELNGIAEVILNGLEVFPIFLGDGNWIWGGDVALASEGENVISVWSTDQIGNTSDPVSVTVIYDTTAPTITIDPVVSPTNQHTATLTGTVTDAYSLLSVTVNGLQADTIFSNGSGTWSILVDIFDGANVFVATATDEAGNSRDSAQATIVGDFSPPILTLLSDAAVNYTPYEWVIGINEACTINTINGVPHGTHYAAGSFSISDWPLSEGDNSIVFVATDDFGNYGETTLTVMLDSEAPVIEITEVSRNGFIFVPEGGVDGVITNAPTVFIKGTVTDSASGIDYVTINDINAPVTNNTFELGPLSLIPRANPIEAKAFDNAGNTASHAITVYQDVEGPVFDLDNFKRAAHVSNTGQFADHAKGNYDGSSSITVTGSVEDMYTGVVQLLGTWDGIDLNITTAKDATSFEFTIPVSNMERGDLYKLKLSATDEFGNINNDLQSALVGQFALRGDTIYNGAGLALAPEVLSSLAGMIESQLEAMDGVEMLDESISQLGITIDLTGMAFCEPTDKWASPAAPPMIPPTSRYGCDQETDVTLSIDGDGYIDIEIAIPYLYIDAYMHGNITCWGGSAAYAKAQPATINLKANFVDGPDGPTLEAVANTVNVNIYGFGLYLKDCSFAEWLIGLFESTLVSAMEDEFTNQIDSILDSLGSALAISLMSETNTDFDLYIGSITNDTNGVQVWIDSHGDPCPDQASLTDKIDKATGEFIPCGDPNEFPGIMDVYNCPGSYLTPNSTPADRPTLNMLDEDGHARTLQAVINDDLINYLMFSEWAQGTFDMTLDQELVGDALTLDTQAFGIFMPELSNPSRYDIQAIVPTGTPIVIEMHPMMPFTIEGLEDMNKDPDGLMLKGGDLVLSFFGDVDGNGTFETAMFDVALTLHAPIVLGMHTSPDPIIESDYISIEIGTPIVESDLIWSAFVMNEATVNSTFPTIFELLLPMYAGSFSRIDLPGSFMRIISVDILDDNSEFINMIGDLQASIAITQPLMSDDVQTSNPLPFAGYVTNLAYNPSTMLTNAVIKAYIGPKGGAFGDMTEITGLSIQTWVEKGSKRWFGNIPSYNLVDGENILRVVVTDNLNLDPSGNAKVSYQEMIIDFDYDAVNYVVKSGGASEPTGNPLDSLSDMSGCIGCQSQEGDLSLMMLTAIFAVLAIRFRRRKVLNIQRSGTSSFMILFVMLFTFAMLNIAGCSSNSATSVTDGDTEGNNESADIDFTDGDLEQTDGDIDKDTDSEKPDGDNDLEQIEVEQEEDSEEPEIVNNFTGVDVDDNPVIIINSIQVGDETEGFNLDEGKSPEGDPDPDNGIASLGGLLNDTLTSSVEEGSILLLFKFIGIKALPAPGESGLMHIEGYLGIDQDDDATNNFDGSQIFGIDPSSFDDDGNLLIHFKKVEISADQNGKISILGGPATFILSIPMGDAVLSLTITQTQIAALLVASTLRTGGVDVNEGLLGGIIPCAALNHPDIIAALGISPMSILKDYVDIDLNEDGKLDKTADKDNEDGITAGILLAGVPAFLDDGSINRAPTISIDNIFATQTLPALTVSGVFDDPDGNCMNGSVSIKVNDLPEIAATTAAASEGCTFSADVVLEIGENKIIATATDEKGADASANVTTTLTDTTKPVVTITGPAGPTVNTATISLTGTATDNVGILGVQISVLNGLSYSVPAAGLDGDGNFTIDVTLPALGENTITVQAKDTSDNLSDEVIKTLTLIDDTPPSVELTEATDGTVIVNPPDDLFLFEPQVTISGTTNDDWGNGSLVVEAQLGTGTRVPCVYDSIFNTFQLTLVLEFGENTLTLYSTDPNSNEGSSTYLISYLDNKKPVITVTSPSPLVYEKEQELRFTVIDDIDDSELLVPYVSLNGSVPVQATFDPAKAGDFFFPLTLSLGTNNIFIVVSDLSGNEAEAIGEIELQDISPPVLVITHPETNPASTFDSSITLTGTVADNIELAQNPVSVTLGNDTFTPSVVAGAFSQELQLVLGDNDITIVATDKFGLTTEISTKVIRLDPDKPELVTLTADPEAFVVETGMTTLTAYVERQAGGAVPANTLVTFTSDVSIGSFSATDVYTDIAGNVSVEYYAGSSAGAVVITATCDTVSDNTTINILEPTSTITDICTDAAAPFAGLLLSITYDGSANMQNPTSDALSSEFIADGFYTHNTQDEIPTLLWASNEVAYGAGLIGRFLWPVNSGIPYEEDFELSPAIVSNLLGETSYAFGFDVCGLEYQLGDLPPVVNLDSPGTEVSNALLTVTASVEDANLASCNAVLSLNGTDQTVDVSSGSMSHEVTLTPGDNLIVLSVTDENSNVGTDSINVRYAVQNDPPVLTVSYPTSNSSTSDESVIVEGTISDDGLLSAASIQAKVNDGDFINCTITLDEKAESGTFICDSALPLLMGSNTIRVEATDDLSLLTTVLVQNFSRIEPVDPPTLTIDTPEQDQIFNSNPITVEGSVTVPDGVTPLDITVSVTLNGDAQTTTWNYFTRRFEAVVVLSDGDNVVVVRAEETLTGGYDEETVDCRFEAPDFAPVLAITSPEDNSNLAAGEVLVTGSIGDDRLLSSLQSFSLNGVDIVIDTPDAMSSNWSVVVPLIEGANVLTVSATDSGSNLSETSITVNNVAPPTIVLNAIAIGGANDGFDVDSIIGHGVGDLDKDNALNGLGSLANPVLADQLVDSESPMLIMLEFTGMSELPASGESVTVTINGYLGEDLDGNSADNFSGTESFAIKPESYDPETGLPVIRFENVEVVNEFGQIRINTYPDNPATFAMTVDMGGEGLTIAVDPAFIDSVLVADPNGIAMNDGLLGGVVPAGLLSMELVVDDLTVNPLEILMNNDPSNPIPDVDLNDDGELATDINTDINVNNPDGISVGIVISGVPCTIQR